MKASEILQKHEDDNEMHLHHVDRKWVIEAMEEYASLYKKEIVEISDEKILDGAAKCRFNDLDISVGSFELGARWYREQLKLK